MRIALKQTDVNQAMLCLKQLIADTPYSTQKENHLFWKNILDSS